VKHAPNIIEFTTDPELLGLSLSDAQEALLRSLYGPCTALTADQAPEGALEGRYGPSTLLSEGVPGGDGRGRRTGG
jgi:hypothetical protein